MSEFHITSTQPLALNTTNLNSTEDVKTLFLREVHNYIVANNDSKVFEVIISKRLEQLNNLDNSCNYEGNLDAKYNSDTMSALVEDTTLFGVPNFYHYIELQSLSLFGGLLPFWVEYKRYTLLLDNVLLKWSKQSEQAALLARCELEDGYVAELVQNIENDERRFLTQFADESLPLSSANTLMNLETFVRQQHWYEMLSELELSSNGEHFILYQQDNEGHKTLVSSAKIQRWREKNDWLAFNPFFQSDNWTVSLEDRNIKALDFSGIFNDNLANKLNLTNPKDLDQSFVQNVKHGRDCCELIRMAIGAPVSKLNNILFLTIKYISIFMKQVGIKGVYAITEQPALLYFFQSVNLYSDLNDCYVPMTYQQINPTAPQTYKGLILSAPMVKAIGECNYKQYYKRVLLARKRSKTLFASCMKF